MADLAEVLLRMAAPMAQGKKAHEDTAAKQASAQKIAQIGADAKVNVASGNNKAKLLAAHLSAIRGMAELQAKLKQALLLSPNNPELVKLNLALKLAGTGVDRLLNAKQNPDSVTKAINYVTDRIPNLTSEESGLLKSQHSSITGKDQTGDNEDWLNLLQNDAETKQMLSLDPKNADLGNQLDLYQHLAPPVNTEGTKIQHKAPPVPQGPPPTPVMPFTPPATQEEVPTFNSVEEGEAQAGKVKRFHVIKDGKRSTYEN